MHEQRGTLQPGQSIGHDCTVSLQSVSWNQKIALAAIKKLLIKVLEVEMGMNLNAFQPPCNLYFSFQELLTNNSEEGA